MSRRTAEASNAIRKAWENEQQLVAQGKGTRDWTEDQQRDILDENKGKAYDENGKAFEGHHMQSAEAHPDYQGEPENIQFLTRQEHKDAHGGDFRNPTNGYYDPITHQTTDFGNGKFVPCKQIELSSPIVKVDIASQTQNGKPSELQDAKEKSVDDERTFVKSKTDNEAYSKPKDVFRETTLPKVHKNNGGIGGFFKSIAKRAADFAVKHPIITAIAVTAGKGIIDVAVSYSNRKSSDGETSNPSDYSVHVSSDKDDATSENSYGENASDNEKVSNDQAKNNYPEHHASPEEHVVPPHRQRYGKDKHWRDVDAYPRGGKKNKDE